MSITHKHNEVSSSLGYKFNNWVVQQVPWTVQDLLLQELSLPYSIIVESGIWYPIWEYCKRDHKLKTHKKISLRKKILKLRFII